MLIKVYFFDTDKSIFFTNLADFSKFLIDFDGNTWSFKSERLI